MKIVWAPAIKVFFGYQVSVPCNEQAVNPGNIISSDPLYQFFEQLLVEPLLLRNRRSPFGTRKVVVVSLWSCTNDALLATAANKQKCHKTSGKSDRFYFDHLASQG